MATLLVFLLTEVDVMILEIMIINENIVISGTTYLLSSVSIDLSKYALDICKITIGKSNEGQQPLYMMQTPTCEISSNLINVFLSLINK